MSATSTSIRGALGLTVLYVFAAAAGATILIMQVVKGDGSFGILAGAGVLIAFGALAVASGRNALRMRRGAASQVGSVPAATP
ncbi:hypothetical protein QNO21_04995 [Microbacterium sp. zg-Y818]|uniref:hypothetical protein n=1 Tax=unclassified Microbacterium TaxID=2609290 RepID=UPI00214AED2C|nr:MULTISPECIES: hypothetical protein [unclassified Microbacterium]MCR2800668.1 hypothetical protein [Microbacterium sp. zg.Y818]WIM23392.1 hypothetical protein QNO21_04995 [Microbacterium sp. zg-Y818]